MKYIDWVERRRWLILGTACVACLFFCWQLLNLKLNPTPYFIDRSHSSRIADHRTKDLFTSTGETAIVVMQARHGTIYSTDYLQRLRELVARIDAISLIQDADSRELVKIKKLCCADTIDAILANGLDRSDLPALSGVEKELARSHSRAAESVAIIRTHIAPIARVRSLTTLEHLADREDNIDIAALVPQPLSAQALKQLPDDIQADPLIHRLFVARDNTASAILVELTIREDDSTTMIAMHDALMALVRDSDSDVFYVGGPPMVTAQTSQVIQHDNFLLTPIVTAIMALILWWCYRRLEAIVIPLTIAGATTLITLGTMAMLGIPLNIVTTVLPVFLISMVIADSVHVLNSYFIHLQSLGHHNALSSAFKELWYPMVFYSVTTMIGFIAMMNTDLTFLKQLGWFVLLGLSLGLLFNLMLLPALLSVYRVFNAGTLDDNRIILWIGLRSVSMAHWVIQRRRLVGSVLLLLAATSLALAMQIKSLNEVIGYFGDDAQIKRHEHAIRHLFGGTTPFNVLLSSDQPERFRDTDVVEALGNFQNAIDHTEHVSYSASLFDYVRNAYRIISGGAPAQPQRDDIAQHLFFYENARDRDIRDVVDLNYKNSRLFVITDTDNTQLLRKVIDNIQNEAKLWLPADIKVSITGFAEILVTSAEEIVGDQIQNVSLALLVIWLAMLALYRSLALASVAIAPLTLSILLNLALMTLLNIPLNIGTALIATVTFGVGIDYAIHIMNNVRNALQEGEELEKAILDAVQTLACGICINSLSVGLGCMVLVASQYEALQNLGILVASGMIICAATTLVSLPMLAYIAAPAWQKYRKADVQYVDA